MCVFTVRCGEVVSIAHFISFYHSIGITIIVNRLDRLGAHLRIADNSILGDENWLFHPIDIWSQRLTSHPTTTHSLATIISAMWWFVCVFLLYGPNFNNSYNQTILWLPESGECVLDDSVVYLRDSHHQCDDRLCQLEGHKRIQHAVITSTKKHNRFNTYRSLSAIKKHIAFDTVTGYIYSWHDNILHATNWQFMYCHTVGGTARRCPRSPQPNQRLTIQPA